MRVPRSTLPPIVLRVLILTDARPRTPLVSARKGTAEHVERSSPIEEESDKDQDGAADANDATGSGIEETDHIDVEERPHDATEGNGDAAPTVRIAKRKLLPLTTDGSAKRDPVLQDRCKRRRHRFAAPVRFSELDTSDETNGTVHRPCESSRERGPSQQSRTPQRKRRLGNLRGQCLRRETAGCPEHFSGSFPDFSRLAQPVAARVVVPQQRWQGEVTEERPLRHGRGRPRILCRIDGGPWWVEKAHLAKRLH